MEYTKSETIVIRLTPEQKAFVERKASRLHMAVSEYARTLLLAFDLVDWPLPLEEEEPCPEDDC